MRIAIFHDYIGAIGGGEKLVLTLARGLGADVITTDVDEDSVKKMGFEYVNIISLGGTVKLPPLKQISASLRFANAIFLRSMIFLYFQETGRIMRREGISRIFLQICEILLQAAPGQSPRPHGCAACGGGGQVFLAASHSIENME